MAVTKVGLVFYEEDGPDKPFRWVYPTHDDSELDDPQWLTLGVDPSKKVRMIRVSKNSPAAEHNPNNGAKA